MPRSSATGRSVGWEGRRMDVDIGVDGYVDLVEIGRGGFGVVYRARQIAFDRPVAIKVLAPGGMTDDSRHRFAREARSEVGVLSVLNSSIRRPLRGGYWVVYAGPFATQQKAARRAGKIHSAGYQAAYTRELIR